MPSPVAPRVERALVPPRPDSPIRLGRRGRPRLTPRTTTASTDVVAQLLLASANGCEASFADLYALTHTRVYAVAARVLRAPDHAREVTQEVYLEVWRKAATCDPRRGSALSWMLTIAHRRAVDRVRTVSAATLREQTVAVRDAHDLLWDEWDDVVDRLDADRVHGALTGLTARQREAVVLMYFEHNTSRQIALRLGLPLGTVKTRIHDGLRSLRGLLSCA